jgi:polyphosphate glucokinase
MVDEGETTIGEGAHKAGRRGSADQPRQKLAAAERPAGPGVVEEQPTGEASATAQRPDQVLVIDIGGTKIKILATGQTEPRTFASGKHMTPAKMVEEVKDLAKDWSYEAISMGIPGLVGDHGPASEPRNLGPGWVGFDYAAALGMPVRIANDAAMQALGSYEGGRMLFLGLGTGLGSALVVGNAVITLELGQLPYGADETIGEVLGRAGLERVGKKVWRDAVARIVPALMDAFNANYVMLGGGNSKHIKVLPPGARLGHNLTAFRGGFRLWHLDDVPTLGDGVSLPSPPAPSSEWRIM